MPQSLGDVTILQDSALDPGPPQRTTILGGNPTSPRLLLFLLGDQTGLYRQGTTLSDVVRADVPVPVGGLNYFELLSFTASNIKAGP